MCAVFVHMYSCSVQNRKIKKYVFGYSTIQKNGENGEKTNKSNVNITAGN